MFLKIKRNASRFYIFRQRERKKVVPVGHSVGRESRPMKSETRWCPLPIVRLYFYVSLLFFFLLYTFLDFPRHGNRVNNTIHYYVAGSVRFFLGLSQNIWTKIAGLDPVDVCSIVFSLASSCTAWENLTNSIRPKKKKYLLFSFFLEI